ncbi:unnamed protein product [Ceutorhynchus assimilis]|uniref:Ionotropic glutamate receptor C-terminal domain-containing protein n=1 Tax=Ceutorhynchus assimilis TaxID=467358 RepID=A0A9N9MTG7_9CUCU|nr:unnamed protein product [Ceutorhynchus assimilis]
MVKNGEADVFLGSTVYTDQTTNMHFSHPYFQTWYHLYFKVPEGRPARYLHFKAFSDRMWLLLLGFYSFLTFMLWLTCFILKKFVPRVEILLSVPTYFLGVMAAFFNTGHDLNLRSCSARLQLISALFFGLICYSLLSASLVANLTTLDRPKPISSLDDVWQQDTYALCMRNITFLYDQFVNKNRTILPKYKNNLNTKKCPRNMLVWESIPASICKSNVIILENMIIMGLALPHVRCQLTMLPKRYNGTGNYIVYSKKFKLRKVIDLMSTRIWSSGIRSKLRSKWVPLMLPNFSTTNDIIQSTTFSHVSDLIGIYCILMLVSLFILGLELILALVLEKKKHQVEIIRFKTVAYRNY